MFLSLKLTLGALSAVAVAVVASVTLGIALTTSFAALRDLGTRHTEVLMAVAESKTTNLFSTSTDSTLALANVTQALNFTLPWNATAHTRSTLRALMLQNFWRAGPEMSSIFLLLEDGSELIVATGDDQEYLLQKYPDRPYATTSSAQQLQQHYTSKQEMFWKNNRTMADADLSGFEGLNLTSHRDNGFWATTMTLTFNGYAPATIPPLASLLAGDPLLAIASGVPIYRDPLLPRVASNVKGFAIAALTTNRIGHFLAGAKSTPNTFAVAYDGIGYLLGSSENREVFTQEPISLRNPHAGCGSTEFINSATAADENLYLCRFALRDYGDARLTDLADNHRALLYPELEQRPVRRLSLPGGGAYITVIQVPMAFRGVTVYLLLILPEADVLGDVVTGRNVAIGVTCGLVVLFAVLNVALVMALLAPLSGIAARMHRAASFDDDGEDEAVSAMAEVAELQEAYYAMNEELNRIRSYVPQSVLIVKRKDTRTEEADATSDAARQTGKQTGTDSETGSFSISGHRGSDAVLVDGEADRRSIKTHVSHRSSRRTNKSSSKPPLSHASGSLHAAAAGCAELVVAAPRNVSVLCGSVVGLHEAAARGGAAGIAEACSREIAAAAGLLEAEVAAQQGVLTFHGDQFLATFNAARPCASHAARALRAGLAVTAHGAAVAAGLTPQALGSSQGRSRREPRAAIAAPRRIACGVDTGRCVVGSMGSATMKALSTVGPAVANASALERLAQRYCCPPSSAADRSSSGPTSPTAAGGGAGAGMAMQRSAGSNTMSRSHSFGGPPPAAAPPPPRLLVTTQKTVSDAALPNVAHVYCDAAVLGHWAGARPTLVATLADVPELGKARDAADGEWLYLMGAGLELPHVRWNDCWELVLRGDAAAARSAFVAACAVLGVAVPGFRASEQPLSPGRSTDDDAAEGSAIGDVALLPPAVGLHSGRTRASDSEYAAASPRQATPQQGHLPPARLVEVMRALDALPPGPLPGEQRGKPSLARAQLVAFDPRPAALPCVAEFLAPASDDSARPEQRTTPEQLPLPAT